MYLVCACLDCEAAPQQGFPACRRCASPTCCRDMYICPPVRCPVMFPPRTPARIFLFPFALCRNGLYHVGTNFLVFHCFHVSDALRSALCRCVCVFVCAVFVSAFWACALASSPCSSALFRCWLFLWHSTVYDTSLMTHLFHLGHFFCGHASLADRSADWYVPRRRFILPWSFSRQIHLTPLPPLLPAGSSVSPFARQGGVSPPCQVRLSFFACIYSVHGTAPRFANCAAGGARRGETAARRVRGCDEALQGTRTEQMAARLRGCAA